MTRILVVPGLGGSGPQHWQALWERSDPRCQRVQQRNWDEPDKEAWSSALSEAVHAECVPTLLVAHSVGCALVAHWARREPANHVFGALLVAPADVESEAHTPSVLRGFAPLPRDPLPFPSIVVASSDDPFASLARAREFAQAWAARFVSVGDAGHINADSGLSEWPFGRTLLDDLARAKGFTLDARLRNDTVLLGESGLSLLLLMNERRYPWLILVPKRAELAEWFELDARDRHTLVDESCAVSRALSQVFRAHKINVGALGNVVRQLHVHHVARSQGDPAWPGPVWGHSPREPYGQADLERVRQRLAASELRQWFALR